MTSGLSAVAAWDTRLLGNAVTTLRSVGDRLASWRARVEQVGRALQAAECWSGEAGQAAAGTLVRLSTVGTEVGAALDRSLVHADVVVLLAARAADEAGAARAAAAAVPVALDEQGVLGPLPPVPLEAGLDPATALAHQYARIGEQAVAAAQAAEVATAARGWAHQAAEQAGEALAALAVVGVFGGVPPATFADLSAVVGAPPLAPVRPPVTPPAVAGWWAAMSEEHRLRWIETEPGLIGVLDGVPAWARDRANRLLLDEILPGDPGFAVATATANEIRVREEAGEVVQLLQFAPEHELVALSLGDLDTADAIGIVVPGVGNDPIGELDDVADDADAVARAAGTAAPGLAVATVAYLGYRPPVNPPQGLEREPARIGGAALDRALDGIAATRAADPARVTVVAHSYGTVVTDEAADRPGDLAADAVVLMGSPGVDNDRAGFEVDEIYEASGGSDPVTWRELHGGQTWDPDTGLDAVTLPTEWDMGHGDYYDPDRPTLAAIGEVVAGTHDG
ncbi:alpha/beta hydrolase [Blastococcus sp. URHD0036]|uniref:alpha/beta hydrolase n=1 Tax=Blastococcus sp. URHD0036 TaxID=1380356 RepID=UPI0004981258|nr:alpha/beta hydrolase [Blastococcus sp. URHD0036]